MTFTSCPYPLECLLCCCFIPFKNILRPSFVLLYLDSPGKITEICFSWVVPLLFHLKTIWLCFPIALFFPSLFLLFLIASFWFIPLHAKLYPVSTSSLPHLCGASSLPLVRRELEHSLFPKSSVVGYGRLGKTLERRCLSVVSVPSLFA